VTTKEKIEVMEAYDNGATIEKATNNNDDWQMIENPTWTWNIHRYRIKANFKDGDWVVIDNDEVTQVHLSRSGKLIVTLRNEYDTIYGRRIDKVINDGKTINPWEPKVGEWCCFWKYAGDEKYSVSVEQFKEKTEVGYVSEWYNGWSYIAPLEYIKIMSKG